MIKVVAMTTQPDMKTRITLELNEHEQLLVTKLRVAWHEDEEIEILLVPSVPKMDNKRVEK